LFVECVDDEGEEVTNSKMMLPATDPHRRDTGGEDGRWRRNEVTRGESSSLSVWSNVTNSKMMPPSGPATYLHWGRRCNEGRGAKRRGVGSEVRVVNGEQ
jgi:hypothetical protein